MPRITLQDGMNILEAAFDKARSLNLIVAVSVVDARGDLVAAADSRTSPTAVITPPETATSP